MKKIRTDEQMSIMKCHVGSDGSWEHVDNHFCSLLGYSREELLSMSYGDVIRPDDRAKMEELVQKLVDGEGASIETELRFIHKNGREICVHLDGVLLRDKKGNLTNFLMYMRTIESDQEINQQVELNSKFLEAINDGYLLIDEETKIIDLNSAYCDITGYTREELLSMNMADLRPDMTVEDIKKIIRTVIERGGFEFETRHKTKDGKILELSASVVPINIDGTNYVGGFVRDETEQKNAKRELEKSEQKFKSLFDYNPNAVYSFDLEGNFMSANKSLESMLGYSIEELKTMDFGPLTDPEDRDRVWNHFERAARGEPQKYEARGKHKDGHTLHFLISNLPIHVDGEIVGVFGIAQDITELKETSRKLKESEERWQRLVENNPQCVVIMIDQVIEYINPEGARLLGGKSSEDIIGKSVYDFVHSSDMELVKKRLPEVEKMNNLPSSEQKIVRLDGEVRDVIVHSVPVMYEGKEAVQTVLQDVTEMKQREQELRESEERWHRLVANNPQPVQVIKNGEIIFLNQSGAELYGVQKPTELIGTHIMELVHPESRPLVEKRRSQLEKGRHLEPNEVKITRKDGEIRYIEIHSIPIKYKGERAIQTVIHDVTERKKREKVIEASLREKEVLLQEIHHRVKNNLAVITGLLELQAMNVENEEIQQILKESQLRINSMAIIHEKLYQSDTLSDIGIDEYIRELVSSIQDTHNFQRTIEVNFDLESLSLSVNQAIPCALILNELVVNCYKHAFGPKSKGTIDIAMKKSGKKLKLSVADDGKGLPEGFKVEEQPSLGMTLIHTLSGQLHGTLEVESRGKGNGTKFTVIFEPDIRE